MQATIESMVASAPATARPDKELGFQWFIAAIARAFSAINPGPDQLEQFIAFAEAAFDKYVVPRDIPGVGPIVEKWLEAWMRSQIRPLILMLFAERSSDGTAAPTTGGTMPLPSST